MAKFLNTSGTNFFLEELIKNAKERLILISPYLRLNDRIKELLEDKDRLKIDIRIVYGKAIYIQTKLNGCKNWIMFALAFAKTYMQNAISMKVNVLFQV